MPIQLLDLTPLQQYFDGEKAGAWCALGLALVSFVAAFLLWRSDIPHRAMFWPLAVAGVVELAIPVVLLTRTDKQVAALEAVVADKGAPGLADEVQRVAGVNRSFVALKLTWAALMFVGLGLVFFGGRPVLQAVGAGLALQVGVILAFDVIAEARAQAYADWLARVTPSAAG